MAFVCVGKGTLIAGENIERRGSSFSGEWEKGQQALVGLNTAQVQCLLLVLREPALSFIPPPYYSNFPSTRPSRLPLRTSLGFAMVPKKDGENVNERLSSPLSPA